MSGIHEWLGVIGLDYGLVMLAMLGLSVKFVILTWWILRKKWSSSKCGSWYQQRCKILANRHRLNTNELRFIQRIQR